VQPALTVALEAVTRRNTGIRPGRRPNRKTLQQQAQQGRAHTAQATVLADLQEVDKRACRAGPMNAVSAVLGSALRVGGRMAKLRKGVPQQISTVPRYRARQLFDEGLGVGWLRAHELAQRNELGAWERSKETTERNRVVGRTGDGGACPGCKQAHANQQDKFNTCTHLTQAVAREGCLLMRSCNHSHTLFMGYH
jgi:hypothetical protein